MYGCDRWTIKMAEHQRIDAFELWCWRRLLRVPWTAKRSNQSIPKEINSEYSLEGLMLTVTLQYFGHLMRRADSLEKTDARKDWRWEEQETTEDEMVGWHHWLNVHEFEQTPADGVGQGSLAGYSQWGHKELYWLSDWTTTNKEELRVWALLVAPAVKNLLANVGDIRDMGLIFGWGRSSREGNGNPFQYSCLKNPMDRGSWDFPSAKSCLQCRRHGRHGLENKGCIPGPKRSPGGGNGNPFQYSCLEISMDRGSWWATIHRVVKSQTWLSDWAIMIAYLQKTKYMQMFYVWRENGIFNELEVVGN